MIVSVSQVRIPAPPAAFPGQADYRLLAARVKDALRAPATPRQAYGPVLDPATRSHEPAAISGKHNQRGSYPTPRNNDWARETPGHPP